AAVREVHERVTDAELRLLVAERRHTVEGAEEVGLDRGPGRPLAQHRRGVEGEVDAGVPDVAVEDPLVDSRLNTRASRCRQDPASGNLGVLPLPEGAEQPTVVEHRRTDETADSERLSLPQLDHLLSRGCPCASERKDRKNSECTERCHSRAHDTPSVKGAYCVDYPFTAPMVKPWM